MNGNYEEKIIKIIQVLIKAVVFPIYLVVATMKFAKRTSIYKKINMVELLIFALGVCFVAVKVAASINPTYFLAIAALAFIGILVAVMYFVAEIIGY